jgi:hypothetical protein
MNLNKQNSERCLLYLAAQDKIYAKVKTNIWRYYLSACIPFIALFLKPFFPQIENFLMPIGLVSLVISVTIDQYFNSRIKIAARIQEEFDTDIYDIEWNNGLAESKVNREVVISAAGTYRLSTDRLPWYSASISTVKESTIQVLLCQRENAVWDWRARLFTAKRLEWIFWGLVVLIVSIGLFIKTPDGNMLSVFDWFSTIVVPSSGLIIATLKMWRSFLTVGKEREKLTGEIEQEIETYKNNHVAIDPKKLRVFQDKIYKTRIETCIVPDWLNKYLQKGFQTQTTKATEMFVEEINKKD